jgi:hypothetical protein
MFYINLEHRIPTHLFKKEGTKINKETRNYKKFK